MTQRLELYRCSVCGNLVQVILEGQGELVCCGEPMKLLNAQKEDEGKTEKHVPIFMKDDNGNDIIAVGSTPHPMEENHYIMFIEAISKDKNKLELRYLYPGDEAKFFVKDQDFLDFAYEYCNLHGLWEGKRD